MMIFISMTIIIKQTINIVIFEYNRLIAKYIEEYKQIYLNYYTINFVNLFNKCLNYVSHHKYNINCPNKIIILLIL